ncbi:hypothetical protein NM688_g6739 [Phlebia brevispora]|uniref:Uncharacterized protein n=1 Tax=Phlebia brevispora TaxID=194682 RepID=A0ACC1SCW9_9APHY|nr:hypothetical protein NM688_g6739 [Phlebia brevispora]
MTSTSSISLILRLSYEVIKRTNHAFHEAERIGLTDTELVSRIYLSERLERFYDDADDPCAIFYAVLCSRDKFPCVYLDGDYMHSITDDYRWAKLQSCSSLREALAWMVKKGGGKRTTGRFYRPFASLSVQQLEESLSGIHTKMQGMSLQDTRDAGLSAQVPPSDTRGKGKTAQRTPNKTRLVDLVRLVRLNHVNGNDCKKNNDAGHATALNTIGGRGCAAADGDLPFVRLRRLDGTIIRILSWQEAVIASGSVLQVHSLGAVVDEFLQAVGYDSATMVLIHHAYDKAKDARHFLRTVGKHGIPGKEALFIWKHAVRNDGFVEYVDYN